MNLFSNLLDLLFPPVCLGCNAFGETICRKCQAGFTECTEQICPRCLRTNPNGTRHSHCKGSVNGLVAGWNYEGRLQAVIKEIKYRYYFTGMQELAKLFINRNKQLNILPFQSFLRSNPIVVPVPLHKKRLRERGFNQSAILGKYLAKQWQLPYSDRLLQRHLYTQPQAELNRRQRLKNIKGSFSPTPAVLKAGDTPLEGRSILLVDDVFTTGVTMQTCAAALKQLGVETIWVLTLAR